MQSFNIGAPVAFILLKRTVHGEGSVGCLLSFTSTLWPRVLADWQPGSGPKLAAWHSAIPPLASKPPVEPSSPTHTHTKLSGHEGNSLLVSLAHKSQPDLDNAATGSGRCWRVFYSPKPQHIGIYTDENKYKKNICA